MNKAITTPEPARPCGQREAICYADLMGFCDKFDVGRFDSPFAECGYDFYTDGHIVVRVKSTGIIDRKSPISESLISYFEVDRTDPQPIPPIDINFIGCWVCRGSGRVTTCKECLGEGELTFDTGYNSYDFECKTCHGDGVTSGGIDVCQECAGSGVVIDDCTNNDVEIVGAKFSPKTAAKMLSLPGVKIFKAPVKPNMYKFIFDGGDGLIMASPA